MNALIDLGTLCGQVRTVLHSFCILFMSAVSLNANSAPVTLNPLTVCVSSLCSSHVIIIINDCLVCKCLSESAADLPL